MSSFSTRNDGTFTSLLVKQDAIIEGSTTTGELCLTNQAVVPAPPTIPGDGCIFIQDGVLYFQTSTGAQQVAFIPVVSTHQMQLQLFDSFGLPVAGTQFWITLTITVTGPDVRIQLPSINFQTGPESDPVHNPTILPGGYLYTSNGFLPSEICPRDLVYRSWQGPSNNGLTMPYTESFNSFPNPVAGYILQLTNYGGLVVQAVGTFGNIIPPGPQVLLPTNINYEIVPVEALSQNTQISTGFVNVTQWTDPRAKGDHVRDSHVNDAFNGVFAWAWVDNSTVVDKTNNTVNVMVAFGSNVDGQLQVGAPIQLTNLPAGIMAWDTSITINRADPTNIIVSYGYLDHNFHPTRSNLYRAVSFDGGQHWPINGPVFPTPTAFGDARGVGSDKYGGIWYSYTQPGTPTTFVPVLLLSTDKGLTFNTVLTFPQNPAIYAYDYPQYCFGSDNLGNYGIWMSTDVDEQPNDDLGNTLTFIPILGLGLTGAPTTGSLPTSMLNQMFIPSITASNDGKVWFEGRPYGDVSTATLPVTIVYKSPGPISQNYAGPWNSAIIPTNKGAQLYPQQPVNLRIFTSIQSIIYDNTRQALYAVNSAGVLPTEETMQIYFQLSRDNGQTFSDPINISTSDFGIRGYQSMALDPITGDLVFGWYDGRNDPTFHGLQYFGAMIPSAALDQMVDAIPLSDPVFTIPPSPAPSPAPTSASANRSRLIFEPKHL